MSGEAPKLECPECGVPLIAASGRGRYDDDGNYIEHRDGCRCAFCRWMWFDDQEQTCECGCLVRIRVDEEHAYASAVDEVKP